MKQFPFYKALYLSFFSRALYRDVIENWKGLGYLYLLLLVTIVSVLTTIIGNIYLVNWLSSEECKKLIDQVPYITIKDGKLSIDRPLPYNITTDEGIFITFDNSEEPAAQAHIHISEDYIHVYKSNVETRTYDISEIPDIDFGKEELEIIANKVFKVIGIIIIIPTILIVTIYRIILSIFYGIIGLIINAIMKTNLTFDQLVRLSVVAITPVVIIDLVLVIAQIHMPYWRLIGVFVVVGYMIFGLKAYKKREEIKIVPS